MKVTPTTKFRIASVSKSLTSFALGKLIDLDKINIDSPITTYLPSFPKKKFNITPRQLASSTAGIRHYNSTDPKLNHKNYATVFDALERFQNDELLFEPGTEYLYSSYGWVLLSAVMEKASGTTFFELLQQTWDDLEMKNTSFDFPDTSIQQKSKFYIYDKKQNRKLAPLEDRSYMYAGGGYLSTAGDMVLMGDAIIQNNFLSETTKKLITQSHKLNNGALTHYGLGWESGQSRLKTKVLFHSGSLPTSLAHLVVYPDEEVVLAYLANTGDNVFFNEREAQTIAELFIKKEDFKNQQTNNLAGTWEIETTSLKGKKTKGVLKLNIKNDAFISGAISFKRSRKKISCPLTVASVENNKVHLVAVSPMFIDLYLEFEDEKFSGEWLHDFNVKGIPEKDDYWKPRKITGSKI